MNAKVEHLALINNVRLSANQLNNLWISRLTLLNFTRKAKDKLEQIKTKQSKLKAKQFNIIFCIKMR